MSLHQDRLSIRDGPDPCLSQARPPKRSHSTPMTQAAEPRDCRVAAGRREALTLYVDAACIAGSTKRGPSAIVVFTPAGAPVRAIVVFNPADAYGTALGAGEPRPVAGGTRSNEVALNADFAAPVKRHSSEYTTSPRHVPHARWASGPGSWRPSRTDGTALPCARSSRAAGTSCTSPHPLTSACRETAGQSGRCAFPAGDTTSRRGRDRGRISFGEGEATTESASRRRERTGRLTGSWMRMQA
jgi:hypothetical protein